MRIRATLPCCTGARLALGASLALALGCATSRSASRTGFGAMSFQGTGAPYEPPPAGRAGVDAAVEVVLAVARSSLGQDRPQIDGRPLPTDCSGFVRGLYTGAGVELFSEGHSSDNGVRAIARWIERHGQMHRRKIPAPGDLAFFDNSYDRNDDGRLNDPLTHIGLVEEVLADGTILIIHATNHGIVREPMNLTRPHEMTDSDGRMINAVLRRKSAQDTRNTPRLMSELFAGFGRVLHREPDGA